MRSGLYIVLLAAMLLAVSGAVCLGQVIKIDPNTPSASAPQEEPQDFWTDNRLEQKVNYEAKIKPVRDILDELTDLTGVKLNAGYNFNDWQVRDRRMIIIAKDLPLKDLMQSIARVMQFKWSRADKDGVWTYRLVMDRQTLLGEEAQRYREEQRESEYIVKQREKLVDLMDKSSQYTEKELEGMRESDPYSYAVVKSGVGVAMADLMRGAPEVRQALQRGEKQEISGKDMSAEAREALVRLAKASRKLEFDQRGSESDAYLADVSSNPEQIFVRFNEMLGALPAGEPLRRCILGDLRISVCGPPDAEGVMTGASSFFLGFLSPDSSVGKSFGQLANRVIEGEVSMDSARTELDDRASQLITTERTNSDWGEPLAEHPEDLDLERVVKFELPKYKTGNGVEYESKSRDDVFTAFVKATGMSIVSDYFNPSIDFQPPFGSWKSEARVVDALAFVEQSFISNWWRHGGVIDVRDRYWFRKRAMQVPDEWIERWMGELKSKGYIGIDNLAQICSMSQEQFHYTFPAAYQIENLDSVYNDSRANALLRFYASLSKYQKETLMQGGLDTRSLSQAQWQKLEQVDSKLQPGDVASIAAEKYEYMDKTFDENNEPDLKKRTGYRFSGLDSHASVVLDMSVDMPVRRGAQ